MLCTNIVLNDKTKTKKNNFYTQHVLNLYYLGKSMNNLLSCCGLTDAIIRVSEKDLPVLCVNCQFVENKNLEKTQNLKKSL